MLSFNFIFSLHAHGESNVRLKKIGDVWIVRWKIGPNMVFLKNQFKSFLIKFVEKFDLKRKKYFFRPVLFIGENSNELSRFTAKLRYLIYSVNIVEEALLLFPFFLFSNKNGLILFTNGEKMNMALTEKM